MFETFDTEPDALKSYTLARQATGRLVRPAHGPQSGVLRQPGVAGADRDGRRGPLARRRNLLRSLRPSQWTKNLLVFAGLIFGEKLLDPRRRAARASRPSRVFCALSGVVYLVNDVRDREADRLHPIKSTAADRVRRRLRRPSALAAAAVLAVVCAGGGASAINRAVRPGLRPSTSRCSRSTRSSLKHVVILDVLTLAIGFVLRAIGGAVAIDVRVQPLAAAADAAAARCSWRSASAAPSSSRWPTTRAGHRRILAEYSPYLLDQMIGVVTASTLLAYAFYTISPETVQKFGTDRLLYTVPFPLYGIFRYLYLVHQREGGGNPSEMLRDRSPLLACVALWGVAVIAILYAPWR